jgi:hypothetical protein
MGKEIQYMLNRFTVHRYFLILWQLFDKTIHPQLKLIKGVVSFIDHWNNCFALSGALTAMSKSLIFGVLLPL